jgi:DNA primase
MDRSEITKEAIARLQLKIVGSTQRTDIPCHCPFHEDKTPSMFINQKMGVYNCFSCGKAGSIEGLFRDITGQSLTKILNIKYDEFTAATWKTFRPQEENLDDLNRNISIDIRGEVVPIRSDFLAINYLRKRGIPYSVADAMKMRVTGKARINGTMFEQRLIIPIYEKKNTISVEGRDITGLQKQKVLYPKDSSVNTLYDIDNLHYDEPLYIVEGLMDLAILRSNTELQHSTAVFGASVTRRQLHLLDKFSEIIMIPDNDAPGMKVLTLLKESLKNAKVYKLQVPSTLNDIDIKDVGDVHSKTQYTINDLVQRKWLKTIRAI